LIGVNDRFLKACRREPTDCTPVWFMRQAGRYMAEYRAIRAKNTLLEICKTPELATQVTLQPIAKLGVDAAILFSDLLVPLTPLGIDFDFVQGEGPQISNPIRSERDIDALRPVEPRESLAFTLEAIRLLRGELSVPLIGFAGAPFTLASYAIEGGPSKNFEKTKALMYDQPAVWHRLAEKLSVCVADYLVAQVEAGAQAVQLFDSWVGALAPSDYRELVAPHTRRILDALEGKGVPRIIFGTGTTGLLRDLKPGAEVVGLDWRVELDRGWDMLGADVAVQGNLDPLALFAPRDVLFVKADAILEQAAGRPGHIFNLGHGILPTTPVDNVAALVAHVHQATSSS
jgi:uroporphyrinogen decarboxylase